MRIAAQFYTLRELTKTRAGLEESLRKCAEIGYTGVQLSAVGCMNGDDPEVDAATAREMLDEFGLACCATHRAWSSLLNNTEQEIDFHRVLGCPYTAVGSISGDFGQDAHAYRRFLFEAEPVAEKLSSAGIRFGYHNHSHEFIKDAGSGRPNFEILTDPVNDWLQLEIDTFWVAHGGASPSHVLTRLPGRIWAIHVKDMEVIPERGPVMAPVGEGNLEWPAILDACRIGGTEWLIVEQDECFRDPFDCLKSSFEFLAERLEG
jgi:sugar phosphate isomerase/epimerase